MRYRSDTSGTLARERRDARQMEATPQPSRLIAIEEHWTYAPLNEALGRLPPNRSDPSLVLNEYGGAGAKLIDLGHSRVTDMDAQGVDVQVLALAPPGTQGLETPPTPLPSAVRPTTSQL